jgi:hypothetical protein
MMASPDEFFRENGRKKTTMNRRGDRGHKEWKRKEEWNNGMVEEWIEQKPMIPLFQHSIIPGFQFF